MWTSILDDRQRGAVMQAADEIVDELAETADEVVDAWSMGQRALVLWEHARVTGSPRHRGAAESFAERAVDLGVTQVMPDYFFKGFMGLGWLFEVMHDDEDPADDDAIDDAVAEIVARPPRPLAAYLDLVSGLVGAGVYFLARPPSARTRRDLEDIVYRLEETAEYLDDGIAWFGASMLALDHVVPCFNVGLAHGVPGIVAFLARALARDISPARTRMLLDGGVQWLLAQQLPAGPSRFPTVCTRSGPSGPARTAWCYGDPGVALALWSASTATRRPDWQRAAVQLAREAGRRPIDACVSDASICHGAAGLVHVFNRLHQASGDDELRAAAVRWVEPTLALLRAGLWDGVPQADDPASAKTSSVLEGKAGVALVLLAAATDRAPSWDGMILADVAPMQSLIARVVA